MKRALFILFLLMILSSSVFSLGRKDEQKPDTIDWNGIEESTLFGLVDVNKDKDVFILVDLDGQKKIIYTLKGDLVRDVEKKAGKYLCIRGRINAAEENKVLVTEVLVIQDSPEPDWSKTRQVEIEGKIELGMNNMVCIITNWESKSRVSHYVHGPKRDIIKKSIGRIIKAAGIEVIPREDSSPFVKEMIVESIVSITGD